MNPDELKNININEELEFNDGVGDVLKEKEAYSFSWKKTISVLSIGLVGIILITFSILEIGKLVLDFDEKPSVPATITEITDVDDVMSGLDDNSWEVLPEVKSTMISDETVKPVEAPKTISISKPIVAKVAPPVPTVKEPVKAAPAKNVVYRVIAGSFSQYSNAANELKRIKQFGFDGYVWSLTSPTNGVSYKVQVGAFKNRAAADALVAKLKTKKVNSYISIH